MADAQIQGKILRATGCLDCPQAVTNPFQIHTRREKFDNATTDIKYFTAAPGNLQGSNQGTIIGLEDISGVFTGCRRIRPVEACEFPEGALCTTRATLTQEDFSGPGSLEIVEPGIYYLGGKLDKCKQEHLVVGEGIVGGEKHAKSGQVFEFRPAEGTNASQAILVSSSNVKIEMQGNILQLDRDSYANTNGDQFALIRLADGVQNVSIRHGTLQCSPGVGVSGTNNTSVVLDRLWIRGCEKGGTSWAGLRLSTLNKIDVCVPNRAILPPEAYLVSNLRNALAEMDLEVSPILCFQLNEYKHEACSYPNENSVAGHLFTGCIPGACKVGKGRTGAVTLSNSEINLEAQPRPFTGIMLPKCKGVLTDLNGYILQWSDFIDEDPEDICDFEHVSRKDILGAVAEGQVQISEAILPCDFLKFVQSDHDHSDLVARPVPGLDIRGHLHTGVTGIIADTGASYEINNVTIAATNASDEFVFPCPHDTKPCDDHHDGKKGCGGCKKNKKGKKDKDCCCSSCYKHLHRYKCCYPLSYRSKVQDATGICFNQFSNTLVANIFITNIISLYGFATGYKIQHASDGNQWQDANAESIQAGVNLDPSSLAELEGQVPHAYGVFYDCSCNNVFSNLTFCQISAPVPENEHSLSCTPRQRLDVMRISSTP